MLNLKQGSRNCIWVSGSIVRHFKIFWLDPILCYTANQKSVFKKKKDFLVIYKLGKNRLNGRIYSWFAGLSNMNATSTGPFYNLFNMKSLVTIVMKTIIRSVTEHTGKWICINSMSSVIEYRSMISGVSLTMVEEHLRDIPANFLLKLGEWVIVVSAISWRVFQIDQWV